jgi:putative transcriptional regulator
MRRTAKAKTAATKAKPDWSRLDTRAEEERGAEAICDPDARPITEEDVATGRVRVVPKVFLTRRRLKLSQEEFAARFHIPIGTLRDWEQRRKEPDAAARAYLRVIALAPDVVRKALASRPPRRARRAE